MIDVLIPVLSRPQRVKPLVENLAACSRVVSCLPLFIVSEDDRTEMRAVEKAGARAVVARWPGGSQGDYARKMNLGIQSSGAEFFFLGADDLTFRPGWAEHALAHWYESRACVVGTNDLGNQRTMDGRHSTHTLVCRDYVECGTADDPTLVLHEGYWHNFVDDEFIQTAVARETYSSAALSIVEHNHPNWGKAAEDNTYRHGMLHFNDDRDYYRQREKLWQNGI